MKLATIRRLLASCGPRVAALFFIVIFHCGVALGMADEGAGSGTASSQPEPARPFPGDAAREPASASEEVNPAAWARYDNRATGLSFRYPSYLRIRERDPISFGLPEVEEITELLGDTKLNPGTVVLRFMVNRGETTPETAAAKARAARERYASNTDDRESLSTMQLDGHEALVAVGCGRAACHWGVSVLQPRECGILTLLGGEDSSEATAPPHDGLFPLLSIIRTVHFHASPK